MIKYIIIKSYFLGDCVFIHRKNLARGKREENLNPEKIRKTL